MSFLAALTFLTIIPIRTRRAFPERAVGRAMSWFPAVGLVIGLLTAAALYGLTRLLPGWVPEAGALVFLVVLTGALHIDGLADSFDGLFGGRDREARLRIMKDTRIGAYGLAAVVCVLLLKFAAFTALSDWTWTHRLAPPQIHWPTPEMPTMTPARWLTEWLGIERWAQVVAIALMPVWGRWMMTLAAGIGPYARSQGGTAQGLMRGMTVGRAALLAAVPVALTTLVLGWPGVLAGVAAAAFVTAILFWWRAKLGGLTGDTLGALGELAELAFLLAVLILLPLGQGRL
jgi:adenosylcobinamide-GDP ribazoletransferase